MNHIVLFVLDFEKVVTIIGSQEENQQGTLGQPVRMLGLLIAELLFCWLYHFLHSLMIAEIILL